MSTIDELTIELQTKAKGADKSIENAAQQLEKLAAAVGKVNTGGLKDIGIGISSLSKGMQGFKSVKMPDFTRLYKGLGKISDVDSARLKNVADAINPLANSIKTLNGVNFDSKNITGLINSLTRLSNANVGSLENVDFSRIGNAINSLTSSLQGAEKVSSNTISITNAVAKLASAGAKADIVSASLPKLGNELRDFIQKMSGASKVSQETIQFTQALGTLANTGNKAATTAGNLGLLATELKKFMQVMSTAPTVNSNIIQMTQALANLASQGGRVGSASNAISKGFKSIEVSGIRVPKVLKGMQNNFRNLFRSIVPFIGIYQVFGFLKQGTEYASDLTEVQNVVDVTFGNMQGKMEDFAKSSIQNFGMSELASKQFASQFQAMGSAMGIDPKIIGNANKFLQQQTNGYVGMSDSMADVSLNLTKLTADMASFYNVEQAAVAEDLQAIFTGQTRPLRAYGLDLTQATLQEWALKQGLDADMQSMSQAEKTMLRYQYVLANTTASHGDFARTANTWANQVRILSQQFQQFGSIVGKSVIAAFKPFIQTLNKVMAKVITFSENVLNALGKIFGWQFEISSGGLTDDLGDTAGYTDDIASGAGDASDGYKQAAKNAKKLKDVVLGIDELNINAPDYETGGTGGSSGKPSGGTGGGIGSGAGASGLTTNMFAMDTVLKAYESSIDSLYELGEYIGKTLTRTMNSIRWGDVYESARNFGKGLADFLNGLISPDLFGAVGRTIAGSLNAAIYAALSFGETFEWKEFGLSIATGINEFFATFDFASLAKTVNAWVGGIFETIWTAFKNIKWGNILKGFFEFIDNLDMLSTTAIGLKVVPGILNKITSSKIIKGFINTAKALAGNQIALDALLVSYPKFGKAVGVASDAFLALKMGFADKQFGTGIKLALETIQGSLSKTQKAAIGAIGVFAEFKLMKGAFYDIASGSQNLISALGKIAAGAGVAVAALKLIGLPNPWTAAITGAVALISAVQGIEKASEERSEFEAFGESVSTLTARMRESTSAVLERLEASKEATETAGVAEAQMAQSLADEYFTLAEKQTRTNDETERMKGLGDLLIQQFPQLEEKYNKETGLIDGTRDSIQKLIDTRLKEAQAEAIQNAITEAYEAQNDAIKILNDNADKYKTAQSEITEAEKHFREVTEKEGQGSMQAQRAYVDLVNLKEKYGEITSSYEEAINAFDTANNDVQFYMDELNNVLVSGAENASANFTDTLTQGLSDEALEIYKKTEKFGDNTVKSYNGGARAAFSTTATTMSEWMDKVRQSIHDSSMEFGSPSKTAEGFGKDTVDGYNLGIENNSSSTQSTISSFMGSVVGWITGGIDPAKTLIPQSMQEAWDNIKVVFSPETVTKFFSETFTSAYNAIKNAFSFIGTWFQGKYKDVTGAFRNIKQYFKDAFQGAYDAVKKIWNGIGGYFKGIANDIITPIGKAVNGVIGGINWILEKVGSKTRLSKWDVPKFAAGTNGLPRDTVGMVNDQAGSTYKELIVPPSGKPFIPEGRNVVLPMEKGTKIMPAKQTKALMGSMGINGMPHFAGGIGDFFGGMWEKFTSFTGEIWDYMTNPEKVVQIAIDKFTDISGWGGVFGSIASGAVSTVFDSVVDYVKRLFDSSGGGGVEKAVRWAIGIANDNSHGYDQANRWGNPDYDCSALVISAFEQAGIKLKSSGAYTTANLYDIARKIGFKDITSSVNMGSADGMRRGDILLSRGHHTAIYIGDGKVVQASSNEHGGIRGGIPGDQTGKEIWTRPYYNYPWTDVLRYVSGYKNGIGKISASDLFPRYEVGGFPEDGLFMANHNEIVGRFSNGRTAVANDYQIEEGIEEATYRGYMRAHADTRETTLLEEIRDAIREGKTISIDGREIVTVYDSRKARNGFSFT